MNNTNPPALEVRNLGKSFGKTEVLRGISFTLERGAVLALIGSSGGGKTTRKMNAPAAAVKRPASPVPQMLLPNTMPGK